MMREIGIQEKDFKNFERYFSEEGKNICTTLDADTFFEDIKIEFDLRNLPPNCSFLIDGFVNKFEENSFIEPLIGKLSNKYRMGLLTNMYPRMLNKIQKRNLLPNSKWEIILDSSEILLAKLKDEIFNYAEK